MSLLRASNLAIDMLGAIERDLEENGTHAIPAELRAVLAEDAVSMARAALRLARVFNGTGTEIEV